MGLTHEPKPNLSSYYSRRQELIRYQVTTLVGHLESLQSHLMSIQAAAAAPPPTPSQAPQGGGNCKLTDRDVGLMVDYLHEHRAERGEGTFKQAALRGCAHYVNEQGDCQGKPKDAASVKTKFKTVSSDLLSESPISH